MKKEEWKSAFGFYGTGEVSNNGLFKYLNFNRTGKEHLLIPRLNNKGYQMVCLSKNGVARNYTVHKLVALAFIPNPNNLPEVNHKDENKLNNRADNLEWCSPTYNVNYGTVLQRKGIAYKKGAYTQRCKILAVYIDGVKLGEYNGYKEASEALGVSPEYISQIANGRPHKHYKVEIKRPRSYQVAQFFEGELVAVYPSISSAAKRVGADLHILSKAAKEERLFKGFTWRCI